MKKNKRNKNSDPIASDTDRDEIRMARSGAAGSGYHSPTLQDIEDIKKDHSTSSGPGTINADEGVRRDWEDTPGPVDSMSGKVVEPTEEDLGERNIA